MIKLIASDIDGTLVPDGTMKIDPQMINVIKRCRKNNIIFAGASGRQYYSMAKLFAPVADQIYYITDNGTILRDQKKIYDITELNRRSLFEMIKDAKDLPGSDIMLCAKDAAYCEDEGKMFYWMRDSYHFNIKVIGDFETNLDRYEDIVKISIYYDGDCEALVNKDFRPKWGNKFQIQSAGTMWTEVMSPEADKGAKVRKLQEILGISQHETMAFGDNLNDIGLLAAADESYAIGSARDEVKEAAKYIAPPLSEYGVTTVITRYLDSIGAEK